MSKIKICGIKRPEDIEFINRYKPDYIGFVFAESKRRVGLEKAKALVDMLDGGIKKVGVFVNEDEETVLDIVRGCSLDVVQLHGNETSEYIKTLKNLNETYGKPDIEIWKAIRVKDKASIEDMKCFEVDAFVLDTFSEGAYGGAGKVFDWSLALEAKKYGKIFLAGGLNSQNVQDALETVKPYGVDISSGVETEGFKDEEKVKEFICRVRENTSFLPLFPQKENGTYKDFK